jgi:hypothetical protein
MNEEEIFQLLRNLKTRSILKDGIPLGRKDKKTKSGLNLIK